MSRKTSHTKVVPLTDQMLTSYQENVVGHSSSNLGSIPNNTGGRDIEFIDWVTKNIRKRVCDKFVPIKEKLERENTLFPNTKPKAHLPPLNVSDKICHCGYKRSKHTPEAINNGESGPDEWKDENTVGILPTDAFGELEFSDDSKRISKYLRVDESTNMDLMLKVLVNGWHLKTPNLLISVTGGAKNFTMKPRLKEVFRRGLMKAAESTGAWIITGGMNAGVMKHVGEAVRDYTVTHGNKKQVVAIGIAPWGCVAAKETLISRNATGKWPASYRVKDSQRRQSPLDPNHSHFILVDNGTQHKFATEIRFRANLESSISRMLKTQGTGDVNVSIPLVCVVLEGGPGTLETVKSAIKNGTPAVIVEGSGRAADILAFAYSNSSEEEVEVTDKDGHKHKKIMPIFDNELFDKVKKMIYDEWKNKDIDSRVTWVRECLDRRDHMTVFQLDHGNSAKDIDLAILQALLKVNKGKTIDQLRLALAWKRIDIAKNHIFTDDAKWDPKELHELMFSAIFNNCRDFVDLFVENGVVLKEFLTVKRLLQLYNSLPPNSFLYQLLRKKQGSKKGKFSLANVGHLISDLTGDFYQPLYLKNRYRNIDTEKILSHPLKRRQTLEDDLTQSACMNENFDNQVDEVFEEPARELFIWCVLNHKLEMAKFFWEEGKDSIAAALTAENITLGMIERNDDSELEKELTVQASYFSDLAVGVLSECYAGDENRARLLLVRLLPLFGDTTCVQLAVEADNRKFIAHSACQSLLNNIWMGRMQQDNGLLRLIFCMMVPVFITLVIKFQASSPSILEPGKTPEDSSKSDLTGNDTKRLDYHNTAAGSGETVKLERSNLRWYEKIRFFLNAPVIIFIYNCISYTLFLLLFSYILLVQFTTDAMFSDGQIKLSAMEVLLNVWVASLFVEEIRQIIMADTNKISLKFRGYISNVWNVMDVIALLTFLVGLVLRLIPVDTCHNQSCFTAARIIYGLDLMAFFFRLLHMFSVHKKLGPKLDMIGQMMVDLAYFVVILMVFIASYGIATQAMLYPGSPLNISLIKDVLQRPYFQIFGELFLEEIEGEACPSSGCSEPTSRWFVPIVLGVYILITNVLMLNLVIAMFSYTFGKIQERTDEHWKFQRYFLIKEYYDRPPLCPPLILLSHIYLIIRATFQRCKSCAITVDNVFRKQFDDAEMRQLVLWENMSADEFVRQNQAKEMDCEEYRIRDISDRVESMSQQVNQMAEVSLMMQTGAQQTSVSYKLPPVLDDRLTYLEEQLQRTAKALNWIIDSMVERKLGSSKGKPELPDIDVLREEAQQRREAVKQKKKKEFEMMLKRQLELHIKSRTKYYPANSKEQVIERKHVPDDKVPWKVDWPEYEPVDFTDPEILAMPHYADVNLLDLPVDERNLPFNEFDKYNRVNRISYCGKYEVIDGIPLNPRGRTGLCGRGVLGRWGPNHAGDPVVTRWHRDEVGSIARESGKPVLEFLSIQRSDNKEWAIPGGILEEGNQVYSCLKLDFVDESGDPSSEYVQQKLEKLWSTGKVIYEDYADDPRNTDNAWLETKAVNYHDEDGSLLQDITVTAGDNVENIHWQKISSSHSLYGGHLSILQKVADEHTAAF